MIDTVILVLVLIVMLMGVLGSLLPILPSTPLILLAALGYGWYTDFQQVTWKILLVLLGLTAVSQLLDYLATVYGAKKMKASKWGMFGAFAGTLIGFFFGLVGVVVGPFLGAAVCELLLAGKDLKGSIRSGLGAFLGFLGGALGKLLIGLIMSGIFIFSLF